MSGLTTRSLLFGEYFRCSDGKCPIPHLLQSAYMPHEQLHLYHPELATALISAYATAFISLFDTYPMQNADGNYQRVKHPLPYSVIGGNYGD
jgi:hypothetical protein